MHNERHIPAALSNENATVIRIVIDKSQIGKRQVHAAHIAQTGRVPSDDHRVRDAVPALTHAPRNARKSEVDGW